MGALKVFGLKRKEVREGHRFWDIEELHGWRFSQEGLVARMGERIDTGCWWAILKEKELFGRPRHRREDNIIMKSNRIISRILSSHGSGKWRSSGCIQCRGIS
jgi:hypothetical protein